MLSLLFFLACLLLRYNLSLDLRRLRILAEIHGGLLREEQHLCGTCFSIAVCRSDLNLSNISNILICGDNLANNPFPISFLIKGNLSLSLTVPFGCNINFCKKCIMI